MKDPQSLTGLDLKKHFASMPMVRLGQIDSEYFVISVLAAKNFDMQIPAGDRGDHLLFPISGTVLMTQGDFPVLLTGGMNELFFIRGKEAERSNMAMRDAVLVFVSFPHGFTETLQIWGLHNYEIPHRKVTTSLLNNAVARFFVELVLSHANAGAAHIGALEGSVRDLFMASLRANLGTPESSEGRSVRSLAMAYVFAEGLNPDVTVAQIAEKIHISPRQLQRAFAGGEKLSSMLLRHRVFQAEKLLSTAENLGLSMDTLVQRSGFTNARTMNRGLLAVLGRSAIDIRDEFQKRGDPE